MELTLTRQAGNQVFVTCNDHSSHIFDLLALVPGNNGLPYPLEDPVAYGKAIYNALFPRGTAAWRAIHADPDRILFVSIDDTIDAIPWEYAYGPDDFLVLEHRFVRGLPVDQRIESPMLDKGLHIVAVPSNPLSHELEPLNINGEWIRMKEIIQELPYSITLERTHPPTLERVGLLVADQQQRIVHFMGHGGQDEKVGAILCFEKDNGDLDAVTAKDFVRQLRGNVFMVTLNACVSASSGETYLSNLAASLVKQKIPYALGMRFCIPDEDALTFTRTYYSYLARGSSIEEATYRVRLTLSMNRKRQWMIGVPVLYTSLSGPATGFASVAGTPKIEEYQPQIEVSALPRAEGAFQGRVDEMKQLGELLTGDNRPRLITIHGIGGQGKTTLAREAVERFAYAWPGGVWATTLENLPGREVFVSDLARFLGTATQEIHDHAVIEREVLGQLNQRRTLIALDNFETLINVVEASDVEALRLVQFIQQLPSSLVSLIVTSREHLGWSGEVALEIGGLSSGEGATLFRQSAPQRAEAIDMELAHQLSQEVDGHPFSLRLLGGAFNASAIPLPTFLTEYEERLVKTENKYVSEHHRHRTFYASIETSVRYLDAELADLFRKLWLFHAPFLPETVLAIFDPQIEGIQQQSPAYDRLHVLWQRGLLTRETATTRDGALMFYHLLPTMRFYIEKYLVQKGDRNTLLARFGVVCANIASMLYYDLDRDSAAVIIAQQSREDLERGTEFVAGLQLGYYLLHLGRVLQRIGDPLRGLKLFEHALEIAQGQDQVLEWQVLHNISAVYYDMRYSKKVLEFGEQALFIVRKVGDRAGEAAVISNMALEYEERGERKQSIEVLEQALQIMVEVKNRAGEAAILNNIGTMYLDMGQHQQALKWLEQALPIKREEQDRFGEAYVLQNIGTVYRDIGELERALELYEEALFIRREMGDRRGEATTLSFMGGVYKDLGQAEQALELLEQTLTIMREIGDRNGEYVTLNEMVHTYKQLRQPNQGLGLMTQALSMAREDGNRAVEAGILGRMAETYKVMGQIKQTLQLYEQALPLRREVGDRAGEAATLNNIALVYQDTGQLQRALELYEQALPIIQEVGDRAGEATTLNNIGEVYRMTGQPQRALELFEQALPLRREVGDRAGEAATLNNMALAYRATKKPKRALELYEQTLPITQEVGDRAREAATLNNMAPVYQDTGQPQQALKMFEQALPLMREVGNRSGEATTLANIADVLYRYLNRSQEAITKMEQAIAVLAEACLPHDAAGRTKDEMLQILDAMRLGISPDQAMGGSATLSHAQLHVIVENTVAVITKMQERRAEWHEFIAKALQDAQQRGSGWHNVVEFLKTVLAILDGKAAELPSDHPYAPALAQIQEGISRSKIQNKRTTGIKFRKTRKYRKTRRGKK